MESYSYGYPPAFPAMGASNDVYPDHGDGFGEYYGLGPLTENVPESPMTSRWRWPTKQRSRKARASSSSTKSKSRSQSRGREHSREKSRDRQRSRERENSRERSKSRSRSRSRSGSGSRRKELSFKEPSFLDAFRILYLTPKKHKKNTGKYLATQKHRDRVQEYLKADRLGSKHWFFYPRNNNQKDDIETATKRKQSRETCDQRVKVDGDFFRKYKRNKKVDVDSPIAKLKWWELSLYKKLGFVEAV